MFARSFARSVARPALRAAAPRVAARAPRARQFHQQNRDHEGGAQLALVAGAALIVGSAGYIVAQLRKSQVHPSEPKENDEEEDEEEVILESAESEGLPAQALIDFERSSASDEAAAAPAAAPAGIPDPSQAASEGAFNEETGEINWDCPCLGGMATGPCGEEFKAAFSCFVYSEEEPKGIDCVEKFKAMQDCFREHPDVYGEEEIDDDEEPTAGQVGAAIVDADAGADTPVVEKVPAGEPTIGQKDAVVVDQQAGISTPVSAKAAPIDKTQKGEKELA
ncbi:Mitochondrial intermembrane space import and assembly protein 40 [Vanrija pseudolonga]|uniref:Mitochondrial intermembrane space import and assembly protein 40 n=1 Tax=Vanrija pseudolonga TaxID=143232 RepID=A0AAF1BJL4_9TREE|nr:Mitochondrial intermembrane space import and assembly protein 40 [Vanrija pseudolonga]